VLITGPGMFSLFGSHPYPPAHLNVKPGKLGVTGAALFGCAGQISPAEVVKASNKKSLFKIRVYACKIWIERNKLKAYK
jgi:hypothetical protein